MRHRTEWVVALLVVASLLLAACGQSAPATAAKEPPVKLEKIGDTGINRVRLSEKAAQRLDIRTEAIREELVDGAQRKVIVYSAVIYDVTGKTWAYTSPEHLAFVRQPIIVDYIDGDKVILKDGPPTGTAIVTVGVPELYGADTGVGK